ADHYLGIIGFLRTLGMTGREQPLQLYGPPPAKRLLHQAVHLGVDHLPFPLEITELRNGDSVRRTNYSVKAVQVDHKAAGLAYVVQGDAGPGRFNVDAARELRVREGPSFGKLQRGESVQAKDGRIIQPSEVLGPPRRGRRLALSGDTRPCVPLVKAATEADLLIHESTFSDDEQDRAIETRHSTAREAGRVARGARGQRLILTHLSSRHDVDPSRLLAQAREEYAGPVEVAADGTTVELPLADQPPTPRP